MKRVGVCVDDGVKWKLKTRVADTKLLGEINNE